MTKSWIARRYRFERELSRLSSRYQTSSGDIGYLIELSYDRIQAAKHLAGLKYSNRGLDGIVNAMAIGLGTAMCGAFLGTISGYLLSENHPVLMTLGGTISGAIGTPAIIGVGSYTVSKIRDKIYEGAIKNHRNKRALQ